MSTTSPGTPTGPRATRLPSVRRGQTQLEGLAVLTGVVVLMWFIELVNTLDSNNLDSDGILPRSIDHIWGIFTAPFIHASWAHLIANTVPFVFMGVIIAMQGAKRFAMVTLIVIVVGGIGTWLVSPGHTSTGVPIYTIGASGVVFGYATYLFARGFFNRNILELLIGLVVGVVWGGALYSSVVPHTGISWQGHVCGAVGGVVAAYVLRNERPRAPAPGKPGTPQTPLDRLLAD